MKNKIIITKSNNMIHFFLVCQHSSGYLFSQRFSKGVFDYFSRGRSENELRKFRQWGRNPRLDHTITKCLNPSYIRCAMDEIAA